MYHAKEQFIGDKSIGGTIGAVGLGVKYIGESIVGVRYPDMSKRMKPDSTSDLSDFLSRSLLLSLDQTVSST